MATMDSSNVGGYQPSSPIETKEPFKSAPPSQLSKPDANASFVFEKVLKNEPRAPVWESTSAGEESPAAKELQNLLDDACATKPEFCKEHPEVKIFDKFDKKLEEYKNKNQFFRLTEGKIYEIKPAKDCKACKVKVQVVGGNINWYFMDVAHDETTQEFRNLVFRSAALGHLLVKDACVKYYRGTNALHLLRMHTKPEEYSQNHNHYRVKGDFVTPEQFKQHIEGFLLAQERYGIKNTFLDKEDAEHLIKEYQAQWDLWQQKPEEYPDKTYLEISIERDKKQFEQADTQELSENLGQENPCEATIIDIAQPQEVVILPLQDLYPVEILPAKQDVQAMKIKTIKPMDWAKYPSLDKDTLNVIAKAGMAAVGGDKALLRQPKVLRDRGVQAKNYTYKAVGELFDKAINPLYPELPSELKGQ
jgi:hypothetical protein